MAASEKKRGIPLVHAAKAYADPRDLEELGRVQKQIGENRKLVRQRVDASVQPLSGLHSKLSPEKLLKALDDAARDSHSAVSGHLFEERDTLVSKLHNELTRKLWAGELYATGFISPINAKSKPEKIPAHLWNVLEIDYPTSSASHEDASFKGVQVFPATQSDSLEPDRTATTTVSTEKLEDWYRSYVAECIAQGKRHSRDDDWDAAKQHFGRRARRDSVRDIRRRLAPEHWHNTGPNKSAT